MKVSSFISWLAMVACLGGCNEEVQQVSEVRPVRTITVAPAPLPEARTAVGEIRPRRLSDAGFQVTGKVVSRLVSVGDHVGKGQVIARIDGEDYRNRLASAEADVAAAKAALTDASLHEARQRQLLAKGVATRAAHDSAKKSLIAAEAGLKSATAAWQLATDQLAYTELKAEFSGIVTATGAEEGQVVAAGQMIAQIAPANEFDAVFAIAERDLQDNHYATGTAIKVALLSNPGVTAAGIVREVAPIADPATRTFEVKAEIANAPPQMLFGSSVTGRVNDTVKLAMTLPTSAIFDSNGKPAVWVYEQASNSVSLRPITVAKFETGGVIVASGIGKGDVVVTAGVHRLREGQEVSPIKE